MSESTFQSLVTKYQNTKQVQEIFTKMQVGFIFCCFSQFFCLIEIVQIETQQIMSGMGIRLM
jgi:hypothetical protein